MFNDDPESALVKRRVSPDELRERIPSDGYDLDDQLLLSIMGEENNNNTINIYNQQRSVEENIRFAQRPYFGNSGFQEDVFMRQVISQIHNDRKICCGVHTDRKARFICLDERVFYCDKCVTEKTHDEHNTQALKDFVKFFREKAKRLQKNLKKVGKWEEKRQIHIDGCIKSLVDQFTTLLQDLFADALFEKDVTEWKQTNHILLEKIAELSQGCLDFDLNELTHLLDQTTQAANKLQQTNFNKIDKLRSQVSYALQDEFARFKKKIHVESPNNSQKNEPRIEEFKFEADEVHIKILEDYDTIKLTHLEPYKKLTSVEIIAEKIRFFEFISLSLEKCYHLTHLKMDFNRAIFLNDKSMELLGSSIQTLKSLKKIEFSFHESEIITEKGLDSILSAFKELKALQTLHLSFTECNYVNNRGMQTLSSSLNNLMKLNSLSLHFQRCKNINNSCLQALSQSISKLENLTELSVSVNMCTIISDAGLRAISDSLKSLKKLIYLGLSFQNRNTISNQGIIQLSEAVGKLQNLVRLKLNFTLCSSIGDQGMQDLASSLKSLTQLNHLTLAFLVCKQITDHSFSQLSSALASLKSLSTLELFFQGCDLLTDQSLKSLSASIVSLQAVTKINLNLAQCTLLTDKALQILSKSLSKLSELSKLELNLNGCATITDEGVISLSLLKNLTRLNEAHLHLCRCKGITLSTVAYLKNALSSIEAFHIESDITASKSFE